MNTNATTTAVKPVNPGQFRAYQWYNTPGPSEADLMQAVNNYKRYEPSAMLIIVNIKAGTPIRFHLPPGVVVVESEKAASGYMWLQTAEQQLSLFAGAG
jgi:hypothetical protein